MERVPLDEGGQSEERRASVRLLVLQRHVNLRVRCALSGSMWFHRTKRLTSDTKARRALQIVQRQI
jgi:hypothetical protein